MGNLHYDLYGESIYEDDPVAARLQYFDDAKMLRAAGRRMKQVGVGYEPGMVPKFQFMQWLIAYVYNNELRDSSGQEILPNDGEDYELEEYLEFSDEDQPYLDEETICRIQSPDWRKAKRDWAKHRAEVAGAVKKRPASPA